MGREKADGAKAGSESLGLFGRLSGDREGLPGSGRLLSWLWLLGEMLCDGAMASGIGAGADSSMAVSLAGRTFLAASASARRFLPARGACGTCLCRPSTLKDSLGS